MGDPVTTYARIVNGAVTSVSGLPGSAQRSDTGQWVSGFEAADQATREACGYLPVTEVRSALGANQVHGDPVYAINAHDVTATFPVVADDPANINYRTMRADASQAMDGLRQIANSTGTLTGAQLSNAVRLLARVAIRLVRLQLSQLDGDN